MSTGFFPTYVFPTAIMVGQTLLLLVNSGVAVTNFHEVSADLEDVFMSLTK